MPILVIREPIKLELGAGHRPSRGYSHNDLYPFDHIEHVGNPWMLDLSDDSLAEVLALGFMEHLTFDQARDTMRNCARMLEPGGMFLFDVPDYPVWASYYLKQLGAKSGEYTNIPPLDHVRKTLFGWQRWPGDEHKWGWDQDSLAETLIETGFKAVSWGLQPFVNRGLYRARFFRPEDAHLYVCAIA